VLQNEQVCVQPRLSAVNMALPAFAAERRAAAPCCRSPVACDRAVLQLLRPLLQSINQSIKVFFIVA